jgi:ribonuclease BN (tRNA processing enzyme)
LSVEYDFNRTKPVNIYGPPGTETLVKAAMQYLTVSSDIRISDGTKTFPIAKVFVGHDLGTGTVYQDANVKVTAVENTHFHFPPGSPAYGKYKSYSYRFEASDRVVVFTGDTGPSAAVTELARGADLLVSEAGSVEEDIAAQMKTGRWQQRTPDEQASFIRHDTEEHLTTDEVGKMAARAEVKTVVLTHVGPAIDPKDDFKRFADQVKKQFSGKVLVANDLMEF